MQRILIILCNCLLLILLLVGLPAATREQWGDLQLSSASTGRTLLFAGLGLALLLNLAGALWLVKVRKHKVLCWEWSAVYAGLLLAGYAFTRGWLNFHWLRQTLEWLQRHL